MSVYRTAIDVTIDLITQRSRNFRNQVVAVVGVVTVALVGMIGLRMVWPLTGLLSLVPVCGLFLWFDTRRVAKWRSAIFDMWARRDIELRAFGLAIRAVPDLPEPTLNSMLSLLGAAQIGTVEVQASSQTRQAVAAVVRFADALGLRQLAARVCATAIISISACWAAVAHAWSPLALTAIILLLPLIQRWLQATLQRQSRAAVLAAHQLSDFDADTFRLLIDHLPLGGGQASADPWVGTGSVSWQTAVSSSR